MIPFARADAHQIPPTQFRSTTSRNNDLLQRIPVNDGVAPGFRGVCDTVLTQFADSLTSYISMFLRTHRWERTATEPSRAGVDFVFPRTEGTICCKSENASAPVRQHSRCVRESPQHSNSSEPEREHIRAQPWTARGQREYVASSHGSGDQANHSRSIETRKSVCAHIHSACVSDRLSIEQY